MSAVIERNIEIDTHKRALAPNLRVVEIVYSFLAHFGLESLTHEA
jgi:hypothetical protein